MYTLEDYMESYIAFTKAAENWYHAAHHVAKGPGFLSDHNDLYGELYKILGEHYDALIEKSIALSGSEQFACPIIQSKAVVLILEKYESPINKSAEEIVQLSLNLIASLINSLSSTYEYLESNSYLTLGLDDLLTSFANEYEKYLYFFGQRSKI